MNYFYYVGIDVSKDWIDVAFLDKSYPKTLKHQRFNNEQSGFKSLLKWLKKQQVKNFSSLFVCLEHTGVYTIPLCLFLEDKTISYSLVAGAEISNSSGITRGKTDKTDAKRIARYAYKNRDDISIHTLPKEVIRKLKSLLSYRSRLLKAKHTFQVSSKELSLFEIENVTSSITQSSKTLIQNINQQIKGVEQSINQLLETHIELKENYNLLLSVPGIGRQTALNLLVSTKNFVAFSCPKKFAAYAGIAPFSSSSGKSIKSRTRVSPKANKKIKALLSNGVVASLKSTYEYKTYYNKQLEKGKNEFSIKNVIRNKIINRAFAVIKRKSKYIDVHAFA